MTSVARGRYRRKPNLVISRDQVINLRAAYQFGLAKGWKFADFITFNFGLSDYADYVSEGFKSIRDAAIRWYRYQCDCGRVPTGEAFAFIWALENRGGCPHVHWLVYLPEGIRASFFEALPRWIHRAAGLVEDRFYHLRPADAQAINYLAKGCHPDDFVGSPRWRTSPGGQGKFHVKRAGTSLNIAASARRSAGWPD